MIEHGMTRRDFGMVLSAAVGGIALPTMLAGQAQAADTFREGLQIGAMVHYGRRYLRPTRATILLLMRRTSGIALLFCWPSSKESLR